MNSFAMLSLRRLSLVFDCGTSGSESVAISPTPVATRMRICLRRKFLFCFSEKGRTPGSSCTLYSFPSMQLSVSINFSIDVENIFELRACSQSFS